MAGKGLASAPGRRRRADTPRGRPLADVLHRRRRGRWAMLAAVVGALGLLVAADRQGFLLHQGGDWSRYQGANLRVVRVVDGDTLDLACPDGPRPATRVRLWGINTPEIPQPMHAKPGEPFGLEAMQLTRHLADGATVRLDLEPHQRRDRYGRLLAYVQLPDGTVLNERLLAAGLATAETRFPHRELERYQLLEKQARHDQVGRWMRESGDRR